MNTAIKKQTNKLTIIEVQDAMIAFEQKEMTDAEHTVYDWMLDALEERMSDATFCDFLERLEKIAA